MHAHATHHLPPAEELNPALPRVSTAPHPQDNRVPMMLKIAVLEEVLKSLKTTEGMSQNTRAVQHELDQTIKELHLPLRTGWMLRLIHAGAILGIHDFWIERLSADLELSLLPGRLASGAHQAAVLHAKFNTRSVDRDYGLVLRCERLRLHRIEPRLFLPQDLEVPSLTLALEAKIDLSFAFGSNEEWVCTSMRLDIIKLKADFGGGPGVPDMILRWLLEKMLPGAIQKSLLKRMPPELGRYLQATDRPMEMHTELKLWSAPISALVARLSRAMLSGASVDPSGAAAVGAAAEALRVKPVDLVVTLRALAALQSRDGTADLKASKKKSPLIGNKEGVSLLDLLRWRLECAQWDDTLSDLCIALQQEADHQRDELKEAGLLMVLAKISRRHRRRVRREGRLGRRFGHGGKRPKDSINMEDVAGMEVVATANQEANQDRDGAGRDGDGGNRRDEVGGGADGGDSSQHVVCGDGSGERDDDDGGGGGGGDGGDSCGDGSDDGDGGDDGDEDEDGEEGQGGGDDGDDTEELGLEAELGGAAVSRVLDALVVLGRKPCRWKVSLLHFSVEVHLDELLEAFYRRRLRLVRVRHFPGGKAVAGGILDAKGGRYAQSASSSSTGGSGGASGSPARGGERSKEDHPLHSKLAEQEATTRRLRVRLLQLLTRLKHNVGSAELSVRSQLKWVGTRGQQEGHLNMKCDSVQFIGPVNLSVNINSRAQLLSRLTRLVSRRISVLEDGSLMVDLLIPAQPAMARKLAAEVPPFSNRGIPATIEALSLRRNLERLTVQNVSDGDDDEGEGQDLENDPADPWNSHTCLVEARVRDWYCGVQLDLDSLQSTLRVISLHHDLTHCLLPATCHLPLTHF